MDWVTEGVYNDSDMPDLTDAIPPFFGSRSMPEIQFNVAEPTPVEVTVDFTTEDGDEESFVDVDVPPYSIGLRKGLTGYVMVYPDQPVTVWQHLRSRITEIFPEDRMKLTSFTITFGEADPKGNLIFQGRTLSEQKYSSWRFDRPRKPMYTMYLAARDRSDNWTIPQPVTLWHPGIAQLDEPEIDKYPSALQVELPQAYDKYELLTGEEKEEPEKKEILGYVVRVEEVDAPPDKDEIVKERWIPITEVEGAEIFKLPAGRTFEVTVGAFDSVVHPIDPEKPDEWTQENEDLFEATFSEPVEKTILSETTDSTLLIAAHNSSEKGKVGADYICDGESDQVEINDAIQHLADTGIGGSVVLLEGTFIVDGSIELKTNTTLKGQGNSTVIKIEDGYDDEIAAIVTKPVETCHQYMSVVDLSIDGNKDNLGGSGDSHGIWFYVVPPIEDIRNVAISGVEVRDCSQEGIRFGAGTSRARVTQCSVHNCSGGIYVSTNSIVSNCLITDCTFGIMDMFTAEDTIIDNCIVSDSSQNGITLTSSHKSTITNCIVKGSGATGIMISQDDNLLEGNTIKDGASSGIIASGSRTRIMGNVITDNDFGVKISQASAEHSLITNNDLFGNIDGSLQDEGVNTSFGAGNRLGDGSWEADLDEWVLAAEYSVGDMVIHSYIYVCTDDHTSSEDNEPGEGVAWESYWDRI